ncbi:MAG: hypothetical protein HPY82_18850 [Gammaproteobacteria bacterium]|nr:hypothetical protein [Gammaproteobacteria bacterium]
MKPSVYLYSETDKGFELYLGEYSTLEGLCVFDKAANMVITGFGATLYKKYGWATEAQLPSLENVRSAIAFLESEGDIGIIEFEASLPGIGTFSSHDDAECHYVLYSKHQCISILKTVIPHEYSDKLINTLMCSQKMYIACSETGSLTKYGSFEEYVEKNA